MSLNNQNLLDPNNIRRIQNELELNVYTPMQDAAPTRGPVIDSLGYDKPFYAELTGTVLYLGNIIAYTWEGQSPYVSASTNQITWVSIGRNSDSTGLYAYQVSGEPFDVGGTGEPVRVLLYPVQTARGIVYCFYREALTGFEFDVWVNVTQTGSCILDSRDWRGMSVTVSVVRYLGTPAEASADTWEGPRSLMAYGYSAAVQTDWIPVQAGSCGLTAGSQANLWQFPRVTSPDFSIDVWVNNTTGSVNLDVASPDQFPMQVRVCGGHPAPIVKSGADKTI